MVATKLERVSAYVTKKSKKIIQDNAVYYDLSVSRFLGFVGSRDVLPPSKEEKDFRFRLLFELSRIGTNLNQISKELNSSSLFDTELPTSKEIQLVIQELRNLFKEIAKRI